MKRLNQLIEGIERKPASEIVELSITEIEAMLLQARRDGLKEIRTELQTIKQDVRKRGYNASQAIGCIDRMISWKITQMSQD